MPVETKKKLAVLSEVVSVEDAEPLLAWAQQKGKDLRVDLSACSHLHPAALQVLLAAGVQVQAWPAEPVLTQWLQSVLRER